MCWLMIEGRLPVCETERFAIDCIQTESIEIHGEWIAIAKIQVERMRNRRFLTVTWIYFAGNATATSLSAATKTKDSVDTAMVTSAAKAQILQRSDPIHPWTRKAVKSLISTTISRGKWLMENKRSETATLVTVRLILVFDFRQVKICREFPTREAFNSSLVREF